MGVWSPFRGCHKYSEGCLHCYIHKGDIKRGIDTNLVVKTKDFYKPLEVFKNQTYKIKSGLCYMGFQTDFLLEEADIWRLECYEMMKKRQDVDFLFLTKRIERFEILLPDDWNDGYDNLIVSVSIENQKEADKRLSVFTHLPIKHKLICAQPLLEQINIEKYLDDIELVVVGGESDKEGRPLNFAWVMDIRNQCIRKNVSFEFRQLGTHFIKDGTTYNIRTNMLTKQARLANINYRRR